MTPPPDQQPAAETLEEIAERIISKYDWSLTPWKPSNLKADILAALTRQQERHGTIAQKHFCMVEPERECECAQVIASAIREGK